MPYWQARQRAGHQGLSFVQFTVAFDGSGTVIYTTIQRLGVDKKKKKHTAKASTIGEGLFQERSAPQRAVGLQDRQ